MKKMVLMLLLGVCFVASAGMEFKVKVVKKGVPGSTTRPAMKRLKKLLDSEKPYLAVIFFGMNDSVNDKKAVPIPEFKRNMDAMVKYCLSKQVKAVVLTVNPVIEAPLYSRHDKSFYLSKGGANEMIKRYNAAIIAVAKDNGIDYIDFHKAVEAAGGATLSKESPIAPDGVHPSYKGKKLLAGLVAEYIKKHYKKNGTVLCIGDSITYQGYPDLIANILNAPVSFSYTTSSPSTGKHRDSNPVGMLNDGAWGRADTESVEYWSDVSLTLDLGKSAEIAKVSLFAYNHSSCLVDSATFFVSDDKKNWRKIKTVENKYPPQKSVRVPAVELSCDINKKARYVRIDVKRIKGGDRVLLGEIVVK
jgi:lysophospholipase L1-like esterase